MTLLRSIAVFSVTLFLLATATAAQTDPLPTLFVIGDSTANNNTAGAQGWGDPFVRHFDETRKRNIWKDGKVERGSGRFREWAKQVVQDQKVAFLDLTALIADKYESLGQEKVQKLFAGDHTHTSPEGAKLNAALVAAGLKGLMNCVLWEYLRATSPQLLVFFAKFYLIFSGDDSASGAARKIQPSHSPQPFRLGFSGIRQEINHFNGFPVPNRAGWRSSGRPV